MLVPCSFFPTLELVPSLFFSCSSLVLHLFFTCSFLVLHLFFTCSSLVLHLFLSFFTCSSLVLHLFFTCSSLALHLLFPSFRVRVTVFPALSQSSQPFLCARVLVKPRVTPVHSSLYQPPPGDALSLHFTCSCSNPSCIPSTGEFLRPPRFGPPLFLGLPRCNCWRLLYSFSLLS